MVKSAWRSVVRQPSGGGTGSQASFLEYARVFAWLIRDPLRPSFTNAIGPTAILFLSATFQAAVLGLVVAYISLSGADWQLALAGRTYDLTPNVALVVVFGVVVTTITLLLAAGNFWAATRILDLGLTYQERCAERLLFFYREQIDRLNDSRKVHLPSEKLMPLINSDARYLGRALVMLYFALNPLITLLVGAAMIAVVSPWFIPLGIAILVLAILAQQGVMERGVRFSRLLLEQSGLNSLALSHAVRMVTSTPSPSSLSDTELRQHLETPDISRYNRNYYNRLRVAQLTTLVSQSIFSVVIGSFAVIGLFLVARQGASVAQIVAVFFALRFFLGGVTGIVSSAVSVIALKAYFDTYPKTVPAAALGKSKGIDGVYRRPGWKRGLVVRVESGATETINPGAWVGVALAGARPTWLDMARLLERIGTGSMLSQMRLTDDVSLIPVDPPLMHSGVRASLGLGPRADFSRLIKRLDPLRSDLVEIERLIGLSESGVISPEESWAQFSPRLLVVAGLAAALEKDAPIAFIADAGLRTIPERERKALKALLHDIVLVIVYPRLPSVDILPRADRFALTDEAGVFAWLTERQSVTELPDYYKERFARDERSIADGAPLEV